jgi:hypothetical protein
MNGFFAAVALSSFFLEVTPEIRSSYQSLGRILEDRPMQVTGVRAGYGTESFGRFGIRNWDVSSLTDRRADSHRHALYHTEFGPTWQYDAKLAEGWILKNDVTYSWTIYRGFRHGKGDRTYRWAQIEQSLENSYITPYSRVRCCFHGNDYLYFRLGLRKRFGFLDDFYCTPAVYVEGGSKRNQTRNFGNRPDGGRLKEGVSSVSGRLELGWRIDSNFTLFGYVEQYGVVGGEARRANARNPYRCAHNDWTHGGMGLRMKF